jgi:hypothetical protein
MLPRRTITARTGTAESRDKDANNTTAAAIAIVAVSHRYRVMKLALLLGIYRLLMGIQFPMHKCITLLPREAVGGTCQIRCANAADEPNA